MALKLRRFNITVTEAKSQSHLPRFKQCTSQNASWSGAIAGLANIESQGIILKGTALIRRYMFL
jgi:hypothetical protein